MLNLTLAGRRYFEVLLAGDNHTVKLAVKPPKLKTLKKLQLLSKGMQGDDIDVDLLIDVVVSILKNNKNNINIKPEMVEELSIDQLMNLMTAYTEWINSERKEKN